MDTALLDGLVQLSFTVQDALGRVADKYDLSLVQVRLLGILRGRAPTMMQIASYLGLDKSSVTGLVTRAERRGLVERTGSADDRRAIHVALTPEGRALAQRFAKQMQRELATLVEGLNDADKQRFSAIATRLLERDAERGRAGR